MTDQLEQAVQPERLDQEEYLLRLLELYNQQRSALADLQHELTARKLAIMPAEVQDALCSLETEMQPLLDLLDEQLAKTEDAIKTNTKRLGCTIKGSGWQAVYSPGRPIWDNSKLEGYALIHPEVMRARSYSEPSISIRKVKNDNK